MLLQVTCGGNGVAKLERCESIARLATWIEQVRRKAFIKIHRAGGADRLEESVAPQLEVTTHLYDMVPSNIGESVQHLIVVLFQEFREAADVAQRGKTRDVDVCQSSGSDQVARIIDPWNAQIFGHGLTRKVLHRIHFVPHIANLEFIDLRVGKGMHIANANRFRAILNVP